MSRNKQSKGRKKQKRQPEAPPSQAPPKRPLEEILKELEAQGHLRLGTQKFRPFKPIKVKGKPLSQMIIEDRRARDRALFKPTRRKRRD